MSKDIEEIARAIFGDDAQWDRFPDEYREPFRANARAAYSVMEKRLGELDAEVLRLVDALVYAHDTGFEWPSDPLPFGSIAHNLFIERGNDPERIAARALNNESKPVENGHG